MLTGVKNVQSQGLFLHLAEEAFDGVLHEAGDGHRAYAARNRGDIGRLRFDRSEIYVSAELSVFIPVHADVDDYGSILDHGPVHELCTSDGYHEYVGFPCHRRKVGRARVAYRHGCIAVEQQLGHWKTYNLAASEHHGTFA